MNHDVGILLSYLFPYKLDAGVMHYINAMLQPETATEPKYSGVI